jgi:hypothetical protein
LPRVEAYRESIPAPESFRNSLLEIICPPGCDVYYILIWSLRNNGGENEILEEYILSSL